MPSEVTASPCRDEDAQLISLRGAMTCHRAFLAEEGDELSLAFFYSARDDGETLN